MTQFQNKVQLIGHLGKDPEIKLLNNGNQVVKLLMATNRYVKDANGEKRTQTMWHNCTGWGGIAELAKRQLIKGKQVLINGSINNKMYLDKDGIKRYYSEILISDFKPL